MNTMKKKNETYLAVINLFFIIVCLVFFILPFILVISISFTDESILRVNGYRLIPEKFSLEGYRYVFRNPKKIIDAYLVTFAQAGLGTFLSVIVMGLCAYGISRKNFKLRSHITFFIFFTMIFGGGLVPTYILNTQYLRLGNTFWVYIFLGLANGFYVIIMRTFFQGISDSLIESAKIDGAREFTIFFKIILPLSKPVFATIALLGLLDRWNNWFTSLVYIRDEALFTLQYLLQRVLEDAAFVEAIAAANVIGIDIQEFQAPTESMRFAMSVIAAGPMLLIFPFFQRYFVRGLTVGSVKG